MGNWIEVASEPRKLFLAWQAPDHMDNRFRWAVGELTARNTGFSFRYRASNSRSTWSMSGRIGSSERGVCASAAGPAISGETTDRAAASTKAAE